MKNHDSTDALANCISLVITIEDNTIIGGLSSSIKELSEINIPEAYDCYITTDRGFKTAHRLVMLTWKPIPNAESLTIDHLNHNKRENTIYNLEWVTRKENLNRACNDLIKIQENEESKINKQSDFIIYANKAKFNSFDDAAKWIAKKNGMKENTNLDMVKKSILSSIRTQKKYCNINWQMSFKK